MKNLGNFVAALGLLTLTLPLMAFVALAIKCESPGPVLERRQRIGSGGRRFDLLTFRTSMHDPNDALPSWARKATPVGRFLRYTRIDALPQLINAVRGEVSFFEAHGWPNPLWD